jgi:hypothetical protein
MDAISVTEAGGRSVSDGNGNMIVFVSHAGSKAGQD